MDGCPRQNPAYGLLRRTPLGGVLYLPGGRASRQAARTAGRPARRPPARWAAAVSAPHDAAEAAARRRRAARRPPRCIFSRAARTAPMPLGGRASDAEAVAAVRARRRPGSRSRCRRRPASPSRAPGDRIAPSARGERRRPREPANRAEPDPRARRRAAGRRAPAAVGSARAGGRRRPRAAPWTGRIRRDLRETIARRSPGRAVGIRPARSTSLGGGRSGPPAACGYAALGPGGAARGGRPPAVAAGARACSGPDVVGRRRRGARHRPAPCARRASTRAALARRRRDARAQGWPAAPLASAR